MWTSKSQRPNLFILKVENGDFNVITPKFIAFSGPSGTKTEIFPGVYSKVGVCVCLSLSLCVCVCVCILFVLWQQHTNTHTHTRTRT